LVKEDGGEEWKEDTGSEKGYRRTVPGANVASFFKGRSSTHSMTIYIYEYARKLHKL
jgi:hypothetical protein